jgi:hypothetical protein
MNATHHVAHNTNGRSAANETARRDMRALNQRIRKPSTGSRRSPACSEPSSEAVSASDGPSPSQPPPTIWCGCQNCWGPSREGPSELPTDRPLADRRGRPLGPRSPRSLPPGDPDNQGLGGEIAFGALEASLEVEYARDSIGFQWAGCEEGDEVEGNGTTELFDDGTIEIEFAYRNGDEAVLKAKPETSSTAYYYHRLSLLTLSGVGITTNSADWSRAMTFEWSGKRALVTGGAGFLRSHLCERLIECGAEVLCVDNYFTGRRSNIAHLLGNSRFETMRHECAFLFTLRSMSSSILHVLPPQSIINLILFKRRR